MSQLLRNVCVTIYGSTYEDMESALKELKPDWYAYQMEKCPTTGKLHIQGTFGGGRWRFSKLKKTLPEKTHIENCKDPRKSFAYCQKAESRADGYQPVVKGCPPAQKNVKGDVAARNRYLLENGAEAAIADGSLPLSQYTKVRAAIKLYKSVVNKPESLDQLTNEWYHGPPGTGKSRKVRADHPGVYDKPLNKWWDAYEDQEVVVLDDFGPGQACLGDLLKRWADHYPFTAEIKGSATTIRPAKIIVTSNYTPDEIWPEDEQMRLAVTRRFKFMKFEKI